MHFIERLIIRIFAALLPALAVAACSSADGPDRPGELPAAGETASFVLEVNGENSGSRAPSTPEGGYDPGAGFENYIDIAGNDFRFYFFDSDDKFIGAFDVTEMLPIGGTERSKRYRVDGRIPAELATRPFKMVALANWGAATYPQQPATLAELFAEQYSFTPAKMNLSETNTVPLYGVTNVLSNLHFDALGHTDIGMIHLLRAYAKIEVRIAEQCAATLSAVTLTRYNTGGFKVPDGVTLQNHYVHNSYDADYTAEPSIPAGTPVAENLPLMATADGAFIAYVPEFRNVGVPYAERARFRLRFVGDTEEYTLDFARYDKPVAPPMDMLRNVWYRFIVNKIDDEVDVDIHCKVQVVPFSQIVLDPEFGLMIGSRLVSIRDEEGNILYYYDRETGLYYYDPDGLSPVGAEPYPGLMKDPYKGWNIVRDDYGRFLYYYDAETGRYYDINRNEIPDPRRLA